VGLGGLGGEAGCVVAAVSSSCSLGSVVCVAVVLGLVLVREVVEEEGESGCSGGERWSERCCERMVLAMRSSRKGELDLLDWW
jgi:hypothetical protein